MLIDWFTVPAPIFYIMYCFHTTREDSRHTIACRNARCIFELGKIVCVPSDTHAPFLSSA
jgi:hypothetical protein